MDLTYKDKEQLERIKWNWINQRRIEYGDAEWIIGKMYALAHPAEPVPHELTKEEWKEIVEDPNV